MFDFVGDMIHSSFLSTFTGDHSHDAAFHVGDHHHQATNFYTFSGNGKAKLSTSFKSATAGQDINDIPSKKKANSTKEAPADNEKALVAEKKPPSAKKMEKKVVKDDAEEDEETEDTSK
eukprot:GEMP01043102.1.p1 GENE.GEMP01043102.1~~GEMP01043102.1.p1  ORF type:complete len:119 (+),score=36.20 GEMP01043102.1:406-762(+)